MKQKNYGINFEANAMRELFAKVIPFLVLGIMLVVFVIGLIFVSYVLLFGALVGLVLYVVAWVRDKFFPTKEITQPPKSGRTIEHDE
jgi:uncharacterized membrane protein